MLHAKGLYNSVNEQQKSKGGQSSERVVQVESKIKKFDFRDYDEHIEEQLRIPKKQPQTQR